MSVCVWPEGGFQSGSIKLAVGFPSLLSWIAQCESSETGPVCFMVKHLHTNKDEYVCGHLHRHTHTPTPTHAVWPHGAACVLFCASHVGCGGVCKSFECMGTFIHLPLLYPTRGCPR